MRLRCLLAALLLVLSACQVDITVDLEVAEDGSGTVSAQANFDADANQLLGDIASQLRVRDLERAGWEITTISADDGATVLTATKPVPSRGQWQQTLDEIAGPGVFDNVVVNEEQTFATSTNRLSFDMDLSGGWELLSDDDATEALGGEPFGAPLETLTGGRTIDEIVTVDLTATIASGDNSPAITRIQPRFDDGEAKRVGIESTSEDSTAILLRWIAIALFSLFGLAALLAVTGIISQRRADTGRHAPTTSTSLASRVPTADGPMAGATPTPSDTSRDDVRLVVVEPLSILYGQIDQLEREVLPFVREHGGAARADDIAEAFNALVKGSIDTAEFWNICGLGDGSFEADLDVLFVGRRKLQSGATTFLSEMQRRRIPVAATSRDNARWSELVRERDRLSALWPWLVSSDVGATTEDPGMFEFLRREGGVAHDHCLYIDTNLASLDVARELGMRTMLFDSGNLDTSNLDGPGMVDHPIVTGFKKLLG